MRLGSASIPTHSSSKDDTGAHDEGQRRGSDWRGVWVIWLRRCYVGGIAWCENQEQPDAPVDKVRCLRVLFCAHSRISMFHSFCNVLRWTCGVVFLFCGFQVYRSVTIPVSVDRSKLSLHVPEELKSDLSPATIELLRKTNFQVQHNMYVSMCGCVFLKTTPEVPIYSNTRWCNCSVRIDASCRERGGRGARTYSPRPTPQQS